MNPLDYLDDYEQDDNINHHKDKALHKMNTLINEYELYQLELNQKGIASFSGIIKDIKLLLDLLKPIYNNNNRVICVLSSKGIEFVKDLSGVMQFRVRITKERFEQLNYYSGTNSEKLYFGIDLEQFIKGIDFLKYTDESKGKPKSASTVEHDINNPMLNRLEKKILFQEKLSLYIHFDSVGNQLTLSILNKNIFTQTICFIYDCELPIPYYLMDTINMAAITINSYYFKDALNMLHPKCETISISISNQYPHLIVSGSNEYWSSEVGYSNHDSVCSEVILATQQERIIGYYRYKHLMEIYQGLNGSQKIKIIINELGFLVISFIIDDMLPMDNVMFFCSPIMTS